MHVGGAGMGAAMGGLRVQVHGFCDINPVGAHSEGGGKVAEQASGALQGGPIPVGQVGGGIGGVQEIAHGLVGVGAAAGGLVRQQKLSELGIKIRGSCHGRLGKAGGRGVGVAVEGRLLPVAARPPAIVRRYIGESSYGMPSWSGWWTALKKFMAVPLQPTPGERALAQLNG